MMKRFLWILRPTFLLLLVFVVLLLFQMIFFSSHTGWSSSDDPRMHIRTTYGAGAPVTIESDETTRTVDIGWIVLMCNLGVCYLLAGLMSRTVEWLTLLRRPGLAYFSVSLVICLIAFTASIIISRSYWGYYLARPGLPSAVDEIASVNAAVYVTIDNADTPTPQVSTVVISPGHFKRVRVDAVRDPYYFLEDRIILHLEENNLAPVSVEVGTEEVGDGSDAEASLDLSELPALITASGLLAASDPGYRGSSTLEGNVVDGLDVSGRRVLFAGLKGRQVSNDHYPYYEMVFRDTGQENRLSFVEGHRFFFDVAGIEGMEWYGVMFGFSLVGLLLGLPVFTLAAAVWNRWFLGRTWIREGCCKQCGYNLTGNVSGICPECGTAVPGDLIGVAPPVARGEARG